MVSSLIDSGADINQYQEKQRALGMAAARGELAIVKLLLARGFDKSGLLYGDSLVQAAMSGHQDVVSFLLDEGNDNNTRSKRPYGDRNVGVIAA